MTVLRMPVFGKLAGALVNFCFATLGVPAEDIVVDCNINLNSTGFVNVRKQCGL
jgi:hypothetical protein